jgi:hypothetical protein
MRIPVWATIVAAIFVTGFGAFRIYLAFKKTDPDATPRQGFYGMRSRTHLLIGTVYLLLGGALIATVLGWNPFGDYFAGDTKPPPKSEAPTKAPVPIDQLPATK